MPYDVFGEATARKPKNPFLTATAQGGGGTLGSTPMVQPYGGTTDTTVGEPLGAVGSTQPGGSPTFNYGDLIRSDPLYVQTQADLQGARASDLASLRAGRQRAVINFGEVPEFNGLDIGVAGDNLLGDLDETTRSLANQSTSAGLSTVARLNEAHKDTVKAIQDTLAARGLLSSGETGYQLGRETTNFTRGQYDARQKLLEYLQGMYQGYLQAERQRQAELRAAALAAAGRITPPTGGGTSSGSTINYTGDTLGNTGANRAAGMSPLAQGLADLFNRRLPGNGAGNVPYGAEI